MSILITGAASGIGLATAELFCKRGYYVIGMDIVPAPAHMKELPGYEHIQCSVVDELPELEGIEYLVNCAGVQNEEVAIKVNLEGLIHVTKKYGLKPSIKAIVNIASTSGHNGAEFPNYAASKGGVLAYTKWTAQEIAKYGATCNSISPGGVLTPINQHIMDSPELYQACMNENLLGKWAQPEEIAEWIYFLAVINKSMTAQDVIIDNGETAKYNFIW